jgi:hypothetical protein
VGTNVGRGVGDAEALGLALALSEAAADPDADGAADPDGAAEVEADGEGVAVAVGEAEAEADAEALALGEAPDADELAVGGIGGIDGFQIVVQAYVRALAAWNVTAPMTPTIATTTAATITPR